MNEEEWDIETRRAAIHRVKKVARMLRSSSAGKAVVLVDKNINDFKVGSCARRHVIHRRSTTVCMDCRHFDRANLVCRLGRVS